MGKNVTYRSGDEVFSVPQEEVREFLSEVPDAKKANTYQKDGTEYVVPLDELDDFYREVGPGATLVEGEKKKTLLRASATGSRVQEPSSIAELRSRAKIRYSRVDERIAKTVFPFNRSDSQANYREQVQNFLHNRAYNQDEIWGADREMFEYALGKGTIEDLQHFERSPYSPTIAKDEGVQYLRMKPEFINGQELVDQYGPLLEPGETMAGEFFPLNVPEGKMGDPFMNYTVSVGEDEQGRYVSYYDKWDLNKGVANFFLDRRPEFYDRIYFEYDPKYKDLYKKMRERNQARQKLNKLFSPAGEWLAPEEEINAASEAYIKADQAYGKALKESDYKGMKIKK